VSGSPARIWPWATATLAIAVIVHLTTVFFLPHIIMSRVLTQMARNGGYNTLRHGARATADARGVVRPSPDLLYSSCPYDLSKGPLLVEARVPQETYWSVSLFDSETNNFFVRNDRQARGTEMRLLIVPGDQDRTPVAQGATLVHSPTQRGLVLFRTLINDEANFGELDSERREASCKTWRPPSIQG
jgi:uncharacterized membrane protein